MLVTVKLFASYRVGRFRTRVIDFPAGTRVDQALALLDLPLAARGVVLVNGTRVELHHPLQDSDTLALLPLISGG